MAYPPFAKHKSKEFAVLNDGEDEEANLQSALADSFQAAANLMRVPKDEKNRPASPSLFSQQRPLSSPQSLNRDTAKQPRQSGLAAYLASAPRRFPERENSSLPPSRRSSSKTPQKSRTISSFTPLHRSALRVQIPPMSRILQNKTENMSRSACASGEGRSSVPRAMKVERDSATRSASGATPSGIRISSMRPQPASMKVLGKDTDDYMDEDEFSRWIGQQHLEDTKRLSRTSESITNLRQQSASLEIPDDESDDYKDEDEFSIWIAQQHQEETRRLSTAFECKTNIRRKSSIITPRNPPITDPFESLNKYTYNDVRLSPRSCVELQDEDFMEIVHIIRDTSTLEVTIRGYIYRRTREMNGLLDRKLNEICWILHVDDDDQREPLVQGVETRAVSEVVRRRSIRLTNMAFPALSFRGEVRETEETITNHCVLVCRYKYLCFYPNARARNTYSWREKGLYRIRADECDKRVDNKMVDADLRHAWRGDTLLGGAEEGWLDGEKEFLRQEAISHKGSVSRQSLKAPNGPDFPVGDPMKREGVGSVLYKSDLSRELPASAEPADRYSAFNANALRSGETTSDSDELEERVLPSVRALQHRRGHRQRRSPLSACNRLAMDANGYDLDEAMGVFDLSRTLNDSAIEAQKARQKSSQVIEIDARVKTSSSTGISKKHYEGKVTSTFLPSPSSKRKRLAKGSNDLSPRPIKRPSKASQAMLEPSKRFSGGQGGYPCETSLSDSDYTVRHSRSEELDEGVLALAKGRGPTMINSGLLTPLSLGSNDAIRSSSHRDSMSRRKCNLDPGVYMDDVIDLTAPPAHASSSFQSELQHPLIPRVFEPPDIRSNAPQNQFEASPSPYTFARTMPAHQSYNSSLHGTSNAVRLQSRPRSPRSHFVPRIKLPNRFAERSIPQPIMERSTNQRPVLDRQIRVETETTSPSKAKQRRYTFGDCFCGAGGMSRGAVSAGLRVKWGFDFDQVACETYAMNCFGTPVYNVWANEFADGEGDYKCDICHLSPSCKFFSDAHTIQGKDDDMNTASLFSIFNLLEKTKPRVVTLEQTSGLIRRHPLFFNAVINMFTSRGFSIRWRVMNCADFGLAQRRLRLFVIASCPGEVLPPFPKPTHSAKPSETGLKPWTTINDAIAPIPPRWYNHDLHHAKQRNASPTTGGQIASCITTNGGPGNIHPSGKRDYTHREYACLQGFPLGHKFQGTGVKRQIGNAVPPVMATVLLEEVKRSLLVADGLL